MLLMVQSGEEELMAFKPSFIAIDLSYSGRPT